MADLETLAANLLTATGNLRQDVEARAAELAAPVIAAAQQAAAAQVAEAERVAGVQAQRDTDLIAELRRQVETQELRANRAVAEWSEEVGARLRGDPNLPHEARCPSQITTGGAVRRCRRVRHLHEAGMETWTDQDKRRVADHV